MQTLRKTLYNLVEKHNVKLIKYSLKGKRLMNLMFEFLVKYEKYSLS